MEKSGEHLQSEIPGVRLLPFKQFQDERGIFNKPFATPSLEENGIRFTVAETFFSNSPAGVLRGLHFQVPPFEHNKIVVCLNGQVLDIVVDLRVGSPTFGKHLHFELSANRPHALFIPKGLAHGFYSLSDQSLMAYWVDAPYSQAHDTGIHWYSTKFSWPNKSPLVSGRDSAFPKLSDFKSPFRY